MWRSTFDSEILKRSIRLKQTNRTCGTIQAHSDELNWANSRTFHELNSLRWIHLMKSSTFGLGLNYYKLHLIKLYHVNSLYTSLIIWKITCKEKTLLLCYNIRQHLLRLRFRELAFTKTSSISAHFKYTQKILQTWIFFCTSCNTRKSTTLFCCIIFGEKEPAEAVVTVGIDYEWEKRKWKALKLKVSKEASAKPHNLPPWWSLTGYQANLTRLLSWSRHVL